MCHHRRRCSDADSEHSVLVVGPISTALGWVPKALHTTPGTLEHFPLTSFFSPRAGTAHR
ncbi:hypothetical protein HMPREF9576_02244 [Cutibacterium acnes HL110PA2]|nr:hypothetical protein HMPREF9576_02244 [Cutibacterium acnes HL110PA2]